MQRPPMRSQATVVISRWEGEFGAREVREKLASGPEPGAEQLQMLSPGEA